MYIENSTNILQEFPQTFIVENCSFEKEKKNPLTTALFACTIFFPTISSKGRHQLPLSDYRNVICIAHEEKLTRRFTFYPSQFDRNVLAELNTHARLLSVSISWHETHTSLGSLWVDAYRFSFYKFLACILKDSLNGIN